VDKKYYQDLIQSISNQIAERFLTRETNLVQRATFLDADIAEITRQIGLETTQIIYEHLVEQITFKKNGRFRDSKKPND
jgi:uncharacterized protein YheU (UPF0270 family)